MKTPVLICDDSSVARKQMARSLPDDWQIELSFATNGQECLEQLAQGKGDVLFLDLNMPVMDGYEVLEYVSKNDLPTMVVVVSGDIQPEARARVKKLGAIDFIKKPTNTEDIKRILSDYGVYRPLAPNEMPETDAVPESVAQDKPPSHADRLNENIGLRDILQEISNVAMGRAADLLARILGVFVKLPVPKVNQLEVSELEMALNLTSDTGTYSAVCQGFTGAGVAGEALMVFADSSFGDMAKLLNYDEVTDQNVQTELLMDVAGILVGAFLKSFAEQLDIGFSVSHPSVLGQHVHVADLLANNSRRWQRMLAIEITYSVENYNIQCDLLLLFTDDSSSALEEKLSFLK